MSVGWGKITVPKWDCLKYISKVFCHPKRNERWWTEDKCTPPLSIRAMLCIKLMVKMHCNNRTLSGVHFATTVFWEFLLLLFRDMLLIFLLYGFSKHVNISVFLFFACLWDSVLPFYFVYYFHSVLSYWSGHVLFKLVFNFIHFSFIGDSEKQ